MSTAPKFRLQAIMLASFIFITDQAIKYAMIVPLDLKSRHFIHLHPFFRFAWAENRGVSMGFLTAGSDTQRWMLVGLTALIATIVAVWMWREKARGEALALALIQGGACGNIVDRVRYGYVADYLDLHFGEFRPFQIFNFADAAISIGVVILLARAFFMRKEGSEVQQP